MQKLASTLFIVSSCVLFLTFPVIVLSYLTPYFQDAFTRYNVYANFTGQSLTKSDLDIRFGEILAEIQPPFNTNLDSQFYSREDSLHMLDVQRLFIHLYLITGIAIIGQIGAAIYLTITSYREQTLDAMYRTEKIVGYIIVFIIVFGAIFLLTWSRSFVLFHQILFPMNNYWNLDPATSNLIKFLPENIFQELAGLYLLFLAFEYLTWKAGTAVYKRSYS